VTKTTQQEEKFGHSMLLPFQNAMRIRNRKPTVNASLKSYASFKQNDFLGNLKWKWRPRWGSK